jgi:hypothetical protein
MHFILKQPVVQTFGGFKIGRTYDITALFETFLQFDVGYILLLTRKY